MLTRRARKIKTEPTMKLQTIEPTDIFGIIEIENRRRHWQCVNLDTGHIYIFPDTMLAHPDMPDGPYKSTKIAASISKQ